MLKISCMSLPSLEQGVFSSSEGETIALGKNLAVSFPLCLCLFLSGPLGAGKTTFVKGIAQGLAITNPITSPTFNLLQIYQGTRQLIHIDAYRLSPEQKSFGLEIEDLLEKTFCVAVEWPKKLSLELGAPKWEIKFTPQKHQVFIQLFKQ